MPLVFPLQFLLINQNAGPVDRVRIRILAPTLRLNVKFGRQSASELSRMNIPGQ